LSDPLSDKPVRQACPTKHWTIVSNAVLDKPTGWFFFSGAMAAMFFFSTETLKASGPNIHDKKKCMKADIQANRQPINSLQLILSLSFKKNSNFLAIFYHPLIHTCSKQLLARRNCGFC
jgi:hypothetical protein